MASFEILRHFLQILSNDDLNYGILPRLALARGLKYTAEMSQKLISHYMRYPSSPAGFPVWHDKFMAELRGAHARFS